MGHVESEAANPVLRSAVRSEDGRTEGGGPGKREGIAGPSQLRLLVIK